MDAAIFELLQRAVRIAEQEDRIRRTAHSAELVGAIRRALSAAEVYDLCEMRK
jgi:hypothetical protein